MRERENKVLRERKGTIHAPGGGTTYLTIIKTETNEEKNSTTGRKNSQSPTDHGRVR